MRMTAKYKAAIKTAKEQDKFFITCAIGTHEKLYENLQSNGYFWNSKAQRWEYHDAAQADPPTPLVMVRVWANVEIVESLAREVVALCDDWHLVEQSKVYPCRPPKQKEGRVYMKFLPNQENNHAS